LVVLATFGDFGDFSMITKKSPKCAPNSLIIFHGMPKKESFVFSPLQTYSKPVFEHKKIKKKV